MPNGTYNYSRFHIGHHQYPQQAVLPLRPRQHRSEPEPPKRDAGILVTSDLNACLHLAPAGRCQRKTATAAPPVSSGTCGTAIRADSGSGWRTLGDVFSSDHVRKGRSVGRLVTMAAVGGVLA